MTLEVVAHIGLGNYILEFLTLSDAICLSKASKSLKKLVEMHETFWARETLSYSLSFDISLFR